MKRDFFFVLYHFCLLFILYFLTVVIFSTELNLGPRVFSMMIFIISKSVEDPGKRVFCSCKSAVGIQEYNYHKVTPCRRPVGDCINKRKIFLCRCNLLEIPDDDEVVTCSGGQVELKFRPFQIATLLLYF